MALIFILLTQLINLTPFTLDFQVGDGRRLLPELPPGKTRFAKQSRLLRRLREHDEPGWRIRVLLDGEFTGIELDPRLLLGYVRIVFRVENKDVLCVDGVKENRSDFLLRHRYFGCLRNYFWNARTAVSIDRSDTKLATKSRNVEGHCQELASWVDTSSPERYAAAPHEKSPGRGRPPVIVAHIKIESPPCPSPKKIPQQERSRNDPRPLKKSNEQIIFKNENSHNNPPMNAMGVAMQDKRLRDDPRPLGPPDSSEGLVDYEDSSGVKDSFVHGILFVLAMIFCILIKCGH